MVWQKRDYNDKQYSDFRGRVKKRDKYKCQFPNCGSKKSLQVHHILTWEQYPSLRYIDSNGITLCRTCHDKITKNEVYYAAMFIGINNKKTTGK